jgi:hypothetical protein
MQLRPCLPGTPEAAMSFLALALPTMILRIPVLGPRVNCCAQAAHGPLVDIKWRKG